MKATPITPIIDEKQRQYVSAVAMTRLTILVVAVNTHQKDKGLSDRQMSKLLGISAPSLSEFRADPAKCKYATLDKIRDGIRRNDIKL